MQVRFYMDVHIPGPISRQLQLRGIDVLTAAEDHMERAEDEDLLTRAHQLRRIVVTQDARFRAMAEDWQRDGRPFAGLLFGRQQGGSIGDYVTTLQLIAEASEADEWENKIEFIPY